MLKMLNLGVVMVDGTFIKVHAHATGAPKGVARPTSPKPYKRLVAVAAGLNTKMMALTDRAGRFVKFKLRPGNAAEVSELAALLDAAPLSDTGELLGDKAYDSDAIRTLLASLEIIATIPPKSNRREPAYYDKTSYKARHLVENAFADIKQFRGIATRYHKLAVNFSGLVNLAAWYIGTRSTRRGPSSYERQLGLDGTPDRQTTLAQGMDGVENSRTGQDRFD